MDSFWSVANALKDAVKQQTAEITASLQNTDWKSEMNALQEGFKEDTVEIGQKAKEVTEELGQKTIHVAKNLPQVVDEGRRKAVAQLEQLPGSSAARAKEAAAQLQQAGVSLTQMGHRVVANTSEMFDHFSNAIQAEMNAVQDRDSKTSFSSGGVGGGGASSSSRSLNRNESTKFSRVDADVAAMQRDSSTYCDEPDDIDDFETWTAAFDLSGAKPDIAKILSENTFMSELQARIVPVVVDHESFWTRYFYRLHKLEERHAKVAALASRAQMEEDDLGWGTEEEEEDDDVLVKEEVMEDVDEEEEGDAVEPAIIEEAEAGEVRAEPDTSKIEMEKGEDDVGEAEIETVGSIEKGKVNDNPESVPPAEEDEEHVEEAVTATDTSTGKTAENLALENEKKKKKGATTNEDTSKAIKDDDDFSSLDFSGGEDLLEGENDGGDSDWGEDVAEWE
jgi:BSD domain